MSELFLKIENFLFDILGLVLPGLIFLLILLLPICLVDLNAIPIKLIDNSFILSELSTTAKFIENYWQTNSTLLLALVLILSYLMGHFVKVFSIIKYELLIAIFDKSINKLFVFILNSLNKLVKLLIQKFFNSPIDHTKGYLWIKELWKPIKNILKKIFIFKPEDYFPDNDSLRTKCIELINSRLGTTYPDKWYSLYKFSNVITNQESIKSLSGHFLAKYNLYRSLAFIFLFAAFYYNIFFRASANYMPQDLNKITSLIISVSVLLWFTFHYKYKRYWTLCGNETLVSLYYYLNKKKVNED